MRGDAVGDEDVGKDDVHDSDVGNDDVLGVDAPPEADVLDEESEADGQHADPGLLVQLYGGPAAAGRHHHDRHHPRRPRPVLRGEPLRQAELGAALNLVTLVAHFALQALWAIHTLHQPPAWSHGVLESW